MVDKILLAGSAETFGVSLSERQLDVLDGFSEYVTEQNKSFNLTSITDPAAFTEKHLIDSLACVPFLKSGSSLCDVGAGAGFPSFPVAAARPDVSVTAMDSTAKKTDFIAKAAFKFGISNLSVITARAEECVHERESFDAVTARAVAPLPVLAELCLPLVKQGGIFIAFKTENEKLPSDKSLSLLGGRLKETFAYSLPSGDGRLLFVFEKTSPTDSEYPRNYGKIKKSPLY